MSAKEAPVTSASRVAHLVDLGRLAAWMDQRGLGTGPIVDVTPLAGGTQNIVLRLRRADRSYVLRRPPTHTGKHRNETMRREARVLAALASTSVPHPQLIASCADVDAIGAAFYLMEPIPGFCPGPELPEPHHSDRSMCRDLGFAVIDALATLGRVDYRQVGLGTLGRADGWLERQVRRWMQQLDSYQAADGIGRERLPGAEALAGWLEEHQPSSWQPGVLHGDFHFGNLLIASDGPAVTAILDWELCTIGDPLLDLGQLLAWWPGPGGAAETPWTIPGLPTHDEALARYAEQSSRDVNAVAWYEVLACLRLAVLLEGTTVRANAGRADPALAHRLRERALSLLRRGEELLTEHADAYR